MADLLFDSIADALEGATTLDRLEARGTLRLALKNAGLDPSSLGADQAAVVLRKLMPTELQSRGIPESESVCETLAQNVSSLTGADTVHGDSPESVFQRLGS
jgi:hypothetical protein